MKKEMEVETPGPQEPVISQAKAAELCGMTRAAIYDIVRRGEFRSVEVEGRELVYLKEVESFAKSRK